MRKNTRQGIQYAHIVVVHTAIHSHADFLEDLLAQNLLQNSFLTSTLDYCCLPKQAAPTVHKLGRCRNGDNDDCIINQPVLMLFWIQKHAFSFSACSFLRFLKPK